jgi:uncharacterized protein YukE
MTDAGVTIVDFGAMAEAVAQYHQKVAAITGILEAVTTVQRSLSAANFFTGGAASSVLAAIQGYIQVMQQALENLNAIIDFLQGKLDAYQAAHNQAVQIAGAIEQAQWADV